MICSSRCKTAKLLFLVWVLCLTKSTETEESLEEPLLQYVDLTLNLSTSSTEQIEANFMKMKDKQKQKLGEIKTVTKPSDAFAGFFKYEKMSVECSPEKESQRCVISVKKKRVWILVESRKEQEKTILQDFFKIQDALEQTDLPIKTAMVWPEIFECEKSDFIGTIKRLHRDDPTSTSINDPDLENWGKEKLVAVVMYVPESHGRFLSDYVNNKKVHEKEMKKETIEGYLKYHFPQKMLHLLKVLEKNNLNFEFLPGKIFIETDDDGINARILPFSKDAADINLTDNEDTSKNIFNKIKKTENNQTVVSLRDLINETYKKAVIKWYHFGWNSYKKDSKEVNAMLMKTKRNDKDWKEFENTGLKEIEKRLPSQWKKAPGGKLKFEMAVRARVENFNQIQSEEQQFEEDRQKVSEQIKRKILTNKQISEKKNSSFSGNKIVEKEKLLEIKIGEKEPEVKKIMEKPETDRNKDEKEKVKRHKETKLAWYSLRGEIMVKLPPELLPGAKSFLEECKSGCLKHSDQILEGKKIVSIQDESIQDAEDCKIKCLMLKSKECEGINYYHYGEKSSDKPQCDMMSKITGRKNVNFETSSFVQSFLKMPMNGNKQETLNHWHEQANEKHKQLLEERKKSIKDYCENTKLEKEQKLILTKIANETAFQKEKSKILSFIKKQSKMDDKYILEDLEKEYDDINFGAAEVIQGIDDYDSDAGNIEVAVMIENSQDKLNTRMKKLFRAKQELKEQESPVLLPAMMPKVFSYKEKYFAAVTAIEKTNVVFSIEELLKDEDSLEIPDKLKEFLRDEFPYQILHFLLVAKPKWAKSVKEFVDFNKILIAEESEKYVVLIDLPHLKDPIRKENAVKSYKKQLEEIFDLLEIKLEEKLNLPRIILEEVSSNSQKEDKFTSADLVGLFQKDKYIKVEYSKQTHPWGKYHPGTIYLNRNSDSKKSKLGTFKPSSRRQKKETDLEPEEFPMYKMEKDDDDEFTCKKWRNDGKAEIYKFKHHEKIQSILQALFEDQYIYGVEINVCPENKRDKFNANETKARKSEASEIFYTAVIFSLYLLF